VADWLSTLAWGSILCCESGSNSLVDDGSLGWSSRSCLLGWRAVTTLVDRADSHDDIGIITAGKGVDVVVPESVETSADLADGAVTSWARRIRGLQVDTVIPEGAFGVNAVDMGAIVPEEWVGGI